MGGKFHLKLNICERPIEKKYREGKMKRTLKRELNKCLKLLKRKRWKSVLGTASFTEVAEQPLLVGSSILVCLPIYDVKSSGISCILSQSQ